VSVVGLGTANLGTVGLDYAAPLRAVDEVSIDRDAGHLGTSARCVVRVDKTVSGHDPYMAGHFPGLTMLPAVFLLEGLRQAADVALRPAGEDQVELLWVRSARLLAPMLGGERIRTEAEIEPVAAGQPGQPGRPRWSVRAVCTRADGTRVATLAVVVGQPDEEAPRPAADGPGSDARFTDGLLDPGGPPVADHARIRALLPVRHPTILVDRVDAVEPGRQIRTAKVVTASEPCYRGLPEGLPPRAFAYPRTLALESFGQSAALLWLYTTAAARAGQGPSGVGPRHRRAPGEATTGGAGFDDLLMLAVIRDCRFTGTVHPGETLRHVVRLERLAGPNAFLAGEIWADRRRVATVDSLLAVSRAAR